jgi:hypothetical protein
MNTLQVSYDNFFIPGKGQRVTVASDHGSNRVALVVSNTSEDVPFSVLARCGSMEGIINFAGATAPTDRREQERQFGFFQSMFGGNPDMPFRTANFGAMSGGTRVLSSGLNAGNPTGIMTIVEVPGLLHRLNPGIRTLGHAPRTAETLGYEGDHSSFSIADKADSTVIANPDIHLLWLVQKNASDKSEWDGDVQLYPKLMEIIQDAGSGVAAQVFWSGGGVTAKEIAVSLEYGFPILLPRGSGRIVDSMVHALDNEWHGVDDAHRKVIEEMLADPKLNRNLDCITVIDSDGNGPLAGQRWLERHGFAA